MLALPQRLKGLFRYERDGHTILANLESGLVCRLSLLMKDFLAHCEEMNRADLAKTLAQRHPDADVEHFLRRVELYAGHLFVGGSTTGGLPNFSLGAWERKGPQPFTTMTLNLTHDCNLRCDYCFEGIEFRRDARAMPREVALKAVDFFTAQLGDRHGRVIFTGGEPLICFDTIQAVVEAIRASGAAVTYTIKTNGTLLGPRIRRYLTGHGFTIQVSLDGRERDHDLHRKDRGGRGTHRRIMRNLTALIAETKGERVLIHGTVTTRTVEGVAENYDFLNSLGARSAVIKPVMGNLPAMALTEADLEVYARTVFAQARRVAARGGGPSAGDGHSAEGLCGIGLWHMSVDVDGAIYPCYRLSGLDEYRMGHLDTGVTGGLPAPLREMYDWDGQSGCAGCSTKVLCSRGCYSDKLLTEASRCDNVERLVGQRVIERNFTEDEVIRMLPVL